jgi:hypothetical protein
LDVSINLKTLNIVGLSNEILEYAAEKLLKLEKIHFEHSRVTRELVVVEELRSDFIILKPAGLEFHHGKRSINLVHDEHMFYDSHVRTQKFIEEKQRNREAQNI